MSTLGQKAPTSYVSIEKQTITGNGGTSYTLQQSVTNATELEVFVNNIRQEPTTAYTATGTALTMTGAVNSSDSFYVIFQGKGVATTGLPVGSTIAADVITATGAISTSSTITSTGNITTSGTVNTPSINGGQIGGRKNIIINGAMQIAQRGTSSTGLGAGVGYFTLDRYVMYNGADASAGRYTMSQSTVTDLEGFSNALKIDCTTADTSIAAGEGLLLQQAIEGFNVQQLKATSTSTKAFTLSFYAKSNASRAIVTEVRTSSGTNRQACKLHTIGTTWARHTFTVSAASSMQLDNDNSSEMQINFWLHAGSTYSGGTLSATFAASNNANRAAGAGSIFSSTDNTLEITGIQLEAGSQATPFEHRSYGEELALCQRYYINTKDGGSSYGSVVMTRSVYANEAMGSTAFPVEMRAVPTITLYDGGGTEGALTENGAAHNRTCAASNISRFAFNRVLSDGNGTGHFSQAAGAGYFIVGTYKASAELT